MNKFIKRIMTVILALAVLLTMNVNVLAIGVYEEAGVQNLVSSAVKSAYIPSVKATGENLTNDVQEDLRIQSKSSNVIVKSAKYKDDKISIIGNVDGVNYEIVGEFSSISDNGNVITFSTIDKLDNFRVVYCAVEKDVANSTLYFKSFANKNPEYNVATKLYLATKTGNDYIMIEVFGNEFPKISAKRIENLPSDHQLNLYWYAREFEPVSTSVIEEEKVTSESEVGILAESVRYILLGYYEYLHLGMRIQHYMRYEELADIRDVMRNGSSTASATLKITQKWIDAPLENDRSSNSSTLSLRDVSLVYLTRINTAVQNQLTTGTVTQNGAIVTSFKYGLGVGLKGITTTASLYFTWEPGNDNKDTGISYAAHTNAPGSYWREAEARLKTSQYLNSIGNEFKSHWTYGAYDTSSPSTSNAKIVFKYALFNLLDYSQTVDKVDERTISVSIQ